MMEDFNFPCRGCGGTLELTDAKGCKDENGTEWYFLEFACRTCGGAVELIGPKPLLLECVPKRRGEK